MLIKHLSVTILSNKISLKIFHCEMVLQLECRFCEWIGFHKANLALKMAKSVTKKWLKKKKSFPLPMPILETSWIQLRSGPRDWGGNMWNSVLTNWHRLIGHSQRTQLRNHALSLLSSHRKVQIGWIQPSIFIFFTTMLFLRCPNWMSYTLSISSVGLPAVAMGEILSFSYSTDWFLTNKI